MDFQECVHKQFRVMATMNLAMLTILNVIFLHFACVIWKHVKNADEPESEGGCPKTEDRHVDHSD